MSLIDADVFESVLDFADADVCEEFPDGYCDFGFSRRNIRELLRDIPAVDAVPVVRCCQCKDGIVLQHSDFVVCHRGRMKKMDFCSYGERKEGADNEP